jgi:hypothetical protein
MTINTSRFRSTRALTIVVLCTLAVSAKGLPSNRMLPVLRMRMSRIVNGLEPFLSARADLFYPLLGRGEFCRSLNLLERRPNAGVEHKLLNTLQNMDL